MYQPDRVTCVHYRSGFIIEYKRMIEKYITSRCSDGHWDVANEMLTFVFIFFNVTREREMTR